MFPLSDRRRGAQHLLLPLLLAICVPLSAGEIFVDNQAGDDAFDGVSAIPGAGGGGPVRSIRRALRRAGAGDTLVLANHGIPYYESIELEGSRCSALGGTPFIIAGNGATLSGARSMPPDAWILQKNSLWKFTPFRKGHYRLLNGHDPLPEHRVPHDAPNLPRLAPRTWCAWRGSIYYQAATEPFQTPRELPLAYAYEQVGISLVDVQNVIIRNLTIEHFRIDGVNAHDRCRAVILENVKLLENGRAGLAVGGGSLVGLKDSVAAGNRDFQLIVSETAQVELLHSQLKTGPGQTGPGQPFSLIGGRLFIDGARVDTPEK